MANSKTKVRTRPASAKSVRATPTSTSGVSGTRAASSSRSPARPQPAGQAARAGASQGSARARQAASRQAASRQAAQPPDEEAAPRTGPPLWLQLTSLALALVGLGFSVYETYSHFTGSHLAGCPTGGGLINCTKVITSPQSMVFGVIPVAILGLIFYAFVAAIMTPWAWRIRRPEVGWLRLGSLVVGMGFVMYLIYAEVYQIGSICEYCTVVHIVTFLLFCLTVVSSALWGLGKPRQPA